MSSKTTELSATQAKPALPLQSQLKISPWKSLGTQLFTAVVGGALVGLGGMGWFFYQTLESQGRTQISTNLNTEVQAVNGQLQSAEQFALNLKTTTQILQENGTRNPETYRNLVVTLIANKPKLVQGYGLMQTPRGLVSGKEWYGPYIYERVEDLKPTEVDLPQPFQKFTSGDIAVTDEYPAQSYYIDTLKANANLWLKPYVTEGYPVALTSFQGPILNQSGKTIALFAVDISLKDLVENVSQKKVYQQAGHYALFTSDGDILAYPPEPGKASKMENISSLPKLKAAWQLVQGNLANKPAGMVTVPGLDGYLAYQRIPTTNWVMLAQVPYSAVIGPAIATTTGGMLIASLILGGVVFWFVRRLNNRLQPILVECDKLAMVDDNTLKSMSSQDEVGRLSTSFFNLINQLSQKELAIRMESSTNASNQERLKAAEEAEAESQALQAEVEQLLDVVSAVESGDLTVEAEVSARVTGLVADQLNQLVAELARVLVSVSQTAEQVTQGATSLEQLTQVTTVQAKQQAESVGLVQTLMQEVNNLCQDTSMQAVAADAAMEQAQAAVSEGQQQVALMQQGIGQLQLGATQIIQRVQALTDFVIMATQFTRDQKRVATMTRVLALNASMTASRASGQQDPEQFASLAKEFAAIADQVNDLALKTNHSLQVLQQRTDQIQTVISGVGADVVEMESMMGQFNQSVSQSQQVLGSIQGATERVVELGQQLTQSSQEIASAAQSTLSTLEVTAQAAAKTAQQSLQTKEQVSRMEQLAQFLRQRVGFFRLPETVLVAESPALAIPTEPTPGDSNPIESGDSEAALLVANIVER